MKKRGFIFGAIGIFLILLFLGRYFFLPEKTDFTQNIQGVYLDRSTSDEKKAGESVTIKFDGEFYKKNKFANTDMQFIGQVSVDFKEHPDKNFTMKEQELWFYSLGDGVYWYNIHFQEKMVDCVNAITIKKEGNDLTFCMELDHNWEDYIWVWSEENGLKEHDHEYLWGTICAPATNAEEYNECLRKVY